MHNDESVVAQNALWSRKAATAAAAQKKMYAAVVQQFLVNDVGRLSVVRRSRGDTSFLTTQQYLESHSISCLYKVSTYFKNLPQTVLLCPQCQYWIKMYHALPLGSSKLSVTLGYLLECRRIRQWWVIQKLVSQSKITCKTAQPLLLSPCLAFQCQFHHLALQGLQLQTHVLSLIPLQNDISCKVTRVSSTSQFMTFPVMVDGSSVNNKKTCKIARLIQSLCWMFDSMIDEGYTWPILGSISCTKWYQ